MVQLTCVVRYKGRPVRQRVVRRSLATESPPLHVKGSCALHAAFVVRIAICLANVEPAALSTEGVESRGVHPWVLGCLLKSQKIVAAKSPAAL